MVVKHCLVRWWTRRDQSARSIGRILRRARRTDGRTDGSKKGGKNEIESGLSGAYDLQCANGPRGASFWTLTPGQVPVPPRTIANSRCSLQAFRGIVLAFLVRLSARKVSSGFELSVSRSSQVRVQIIFLASFVFPPLPASSSSSSSLRSDNRRGDVRYIVYYISKGAKEGLDYEFVFSFCCFFPRRKNVSSFPIRSIFDLHYLYLDR